MMNSLKTFEKRWKKVKHEGCEVLSTKALKEIAKLRRHIEKGCLSNIRVGAGTNRNENLHKNLKHILSTNRIGIQTAVASLGRFFYRWNEKILQKNSKCRWVKPISAYEAELLSNGIQLTEEVFGIGVQLKALGNNDNNDTEQTTTEQLRPICRPKRLFN